MSVFGHFEQTQIRMRYWGIVVVSIGLTALFTAFKLNFEDRAAKTWRIIVMLLVLLMTQGMVQLACGMPEFTGSRMDPMGFGNLFLAFFIILMIFFIFYAITGRLRISVKVGAIILLILGITNHFLLLFRGDPFYFGDLISAGTGLEVVKGYTLSISGDIIAGIYLFITVFVMSFHLPKKLTPYRAAEGEKWVDVNLTDSTLTAYEGYTQVHGPILINHGGVGHETVTGTYHVYLKRAKQDMGCTPEWPYCERDVPWIAYWYKDYALHGAPWVKEFGIGTDESSHGCINIPVEDAHWIHDWVQIGTTVVIYC